MGQDYIDRPMTTRQRNRVARVPAPVADAGFVDRPVAPAGPLSVADIMRQAPALGAGGLPIGDLMGGVRSALARTVYGGGDVIRRATGQPRILDTPEVVARTTAPDSPAGRFGSVMGDVAQVAIPATRAAGVMRGAGLLKRAATDAAIAGTVAGLIGQFRNADRIAKAIREQSGGATGSFGARPWGGY